MEKQGLLTNEETLLQNLGNHWLGWTYAIIKESTKWALSNLWGSGTTSDNKDFVFCETLDVCFLFIFISTTQLTYTHALKF